MRHKILFSLFLLLAIVGFADAGYITASHYLAIPVSCTEGFDCEGVLSSSYANIGPVPLSVLGAVYYLFLIVLSVVYLDRRNWRIMRLGAWATIAGALFSLYLLYVQAAILFAFCLYCVISATTSLLLFGVGQFILHEKKDLMEVKKPPLPMNVNQ
ncbi:MAG: vitamin K epoxide reductase [Candidatus Harrisonbacteria bacterium CG10_big_fil_rev_8_21_14_0_10_44_23]|uniref:Vitamin K epoxide reductase n=1 Tax=Candidatus Harrisonbacteria bacterium CG10_big_fil_rev_8_21_14_0_10_44_23 TaxID=1974585 RepID=A0A2H0UQ54_9BACT|nr:MAG: vitamin K epoxide reductase [Candidatus Harrisonbacteria bacterium CG10_big_fil_rev_8_21_14_0_10_44_23]